MDIQLFDYVLPAERIAQFPESCRSKARLLVLNRQKNTLEHCIFEEIISFFSPGDVLVVNNTKVIPARLWAKKKTGGKVEILLLREVSSHLWEASVSPGRVQGEIEIVGDEPALVTVKADENGKRWVQFPDHLVVKSWLKRSGHMPLPPYIKRKDGVKDAQDYQTVFAKHEGAIASPTAGLHFDKALLTLLKQQGVQVVEVTLHVGQGTFKPIATHSVEEHNIHTEWMEVSQQAASQINVAREEKKKVIACGTTALRAVESAVNSEGRVQAFQGLTNLYIYPGFEFKIIDALITNFHLPKTTLLVLVSALAGRETILKAYKEAIQEGYRFYSYGDAMLIL